MLKRMFLAPDPGRLRLRASLRAVVGIALAVTAIILAGLSPEAAVAGGLAALLALFTVTDPTVARQARTTALLPAAGFPALALAAWLHELPLLRSAAFLTVVFCGAYARRWGARGHALGVFAFMMFFVAQFLRTVPAGLVQVCAAVLIALAAVAVVRFGLWCIERTAPPPALPAPPSGRGLGRPTTRLACQVTAACAFALGAGQLLSGDRWYWAVGAAWWIFVNTASRGETLVRGFRRVLGTVTGIAGGLMVALPVAGAPVPTVLIVAVCVFAIFYTAAVSYSWMMFFVTVMVGLLYGLLGVLHVGLLRLRFEETALGALGAALAVALVLPVTTHAATDAWIQRALRCVHRCTGEAARRLAGAESADPGARVAELEMLLGRARMSLAPLVHPLCPLRVRKKRARQVLALLDDCAAQVRGLAAVAADPAASHDARLTAACRRVESAVHGLVAPAGDPAAARTAPGERTAPGDLRDVPARHPGAEPALVHLRGLEQALEGLAGPLHASPGTRLVATA